MLSLPSAKATSWFKLVFVLFLVNFTAFITSRYILNAEVTAQNYFAFVILSVIISCLSMVGYWGMRVWSLSTIVGNIIAILYILYMSIFNISDGWTDIASLLGTLMIIGLGFILGGVIELSVFVYRRARGRNSN